MDRFPPVRELTLFALVGGSTAVVGYLTLWWLIDVGWPSAVANTAVVAVTLQLNFLGGLVLTWRRRVAGSVVSWRERWRRFHLARSASAMLTAGGFPVIAPAIGTTAAYWCLFGAAAAANFCFDRLWSFAGRPIGGRARITLLIAGAVAVAVVAMRWLTLFLIAVSFFMLTVAITTLVFQLYKWWRPENNDPRRYGVPDDPRLSGVILVPMRHEEVVAGHTLERLVTLNHPDYWVVPIIDYRDDPQTARIAHAVARRYPSRVFVCPYPEHTDVHNKPIALNAAVQLLNEMGIRFEWIGIADAEDLFHPDLLRMVDFRFRATGAAIVQCGVQLMNFATDPDAVPTSAADSRLRRWWRAHASGWWRVANVLEYYKWFQSRLKLQAAIRVMPLGGNTVFFRRQFFDELNARYGQWWDEECLTEDCKIGILASALGCTIDVVYLDHMVTREETPESLPGFLRQRVRWMQGFIQVFSERDWLTLPTVTQRVLAVYVLGFQFFQAFSATFAPVALALALFYKSPVTIALLATVPLAMGGLNTLLDVVLLHQFGRAFRQRVRLRDYAGLILGAYPYQILLSVAALWALVRHTLGRNNWVKTAHAGAHLSRSDAGGQAMSRLTTGAAG